MRRLAIFLLVGVAIARAGVADEIRLKSRKILNGTVSKFAKGKFSVLVDGSPQEIKNTDIESITFGGTGTGVSAGEAPFGGGTAAVAAGEWLSLADCEKGKEGFLKPTFTVESTDDGRFIGTYDIVAEGIVRGSRAAIIQGVDTSSLVSGKFVKLTQRLRCAGTENLAGGKTVYVFEPVDPTQNQVTKAEDPALSRPVPGGVNVRDIRGR
jgi:hypothetical protein